jgi:hypothetical protein
MTIDMQTIPLDIGTLKGFPLFHLDENVFVSSDEIRVDTRLTFTEGNALVRYPKLGERLV